MRDKVANGKLDNRNPANAEQNPPSEASVAHSDSSTSIRNMLPHQHFRNTTYFPSWYHQEHHTQTFRRGRGYRRGRYRRYHHRNNYYSNQFHHVRDPYHWTMKSPFVFVDSLNPRVHSSKLSSVGAVERQPVENQWTDINQWSSQCNDITDILSSDPIPKSSVSDSEYVISNRFKSLFQHNLPTTTMPSEKCSADTFNSDKCINGLSPQTSFQSVQSSIESNHYSTGRSVALFAVNAPIYYSNNWVSCRTQLNNPNLKSTLQPYMTDDQVAFQMELSCGVYYEKATSGVPLSLVKKFEAVSASELEGLARLQIYYD